MLSKKQYSEAHDLDFDELMSLDYADIQAKEVILGKDSTSNYWYCYILVIVIFMLIVMYGMSIATGVANEKSNRSIEILVTTTNSRGYFFFLERYLPEQLLRSFMGLKLLTREENVERHDRLYYQVYKHMRADVQNKWDSVYAQRIAEYGGRNLEGEGF